MQTLAAYEGDINKMQQQRKRGSRGRNAANMRGIQTAKQKDVWSLPFTTKCSNIGECVNRMTLRYRYELSIVRVWAKHSNVQNIAVWDLKFLHQCCWRHKSSEMWCCAPQWAVSSVSKDCNAFVTSVLTGWATQWHISDNLHLNYSHVSGKADTGTLKLGGGGGVTPYFVLRVLEVYKVHTTGVSYWGCQKQTLHYDTDKPAR